MNLQTHRCGVLSLAALSFFLLCGYTAPTSCKESDVHTGPSGAQVAAAVAIVGGVAIGTAVLVHVHNEHHRLKGCVTGGPGGMTLTTADGKKTWTLDGDVSKLKAGDMVQVHGDREKGATEGTFKVEKLKKDMGACPAHPAAAAAAPATSPAE